MTGRLLLVPNISTLHFAWTKYAVALIVVTTPMIAQATPKDMGIFTVDSQNLTSGTVKGRYTAAGGGAFGSFTITRDEMNGYQNNISLIPTQGRTGTNGIEIKNEDNISVDRDKFKYTFTIIPDDDTAIHTIKIGQASYTTEGNSEISRHTLAYSQNPQINVSVQATITDNSSVPYFYDAMGDYFMGSKVNDRQLSSQNTTSGQQLRINSSSPGNSNLYYYNIPNLKGVGNSNPYSPTLKNSQVELNTSNGVLPPNRTFAGIFKSSADNASYSAFSTNSSISSGSTYVSYGIANSASTYVVDIRNAKTVTLTYEGIMNGNLGIPRAVVGETYSEWISFGVSSESIPNYTFSGTVFNDNGNITDSSASRQNTSSPFTSTSEYFNGLFDSNESGVYDNALQVRLTDCQGGVIATNPSTSNPQIVSNAPASLGKYNFRVLPKNLEGKTNLCIEEIEPSNWEYSVDTTPNIRQFSFNSNVLNYQTGVEVNGNVLNLDFGEVKKNNAALVLKKYQYVHACNNTLNYTAENINRSNITQPTEGFSMSAAGNVEPGKCIAYKIEAYNRGHVDLADIQISDKLQNVDVKSVFHWPKPLGVPTSIFQDANPSVTIGKNSTILSDGFSLTKVLPSSMTATKAVLYFNSKYGTVQSN